MLRKPLSWAPWRSRKVTTDWRYPSSKASRDHGSEVRDSIPSRYGAAYISLADKDRVVANITKGYNLRDHASEYEKFSLSANYNGIVLGDVEKAAQICEQWD